MNNILIMGSTTIDSTVYTENDLRKGETVKGKSYHIALGGKGLNQAFAVKNLGGNASFIFSVGNDENGNKIQAFLKEKGITSFPKLSKEQTGFASIVVNTANAENEIVIVAGANDDLLESDINESIFVDKDFFLCQLENPTNTVLQALKIAKKHNLFTILNSAPYKPLNDEFFQYIDLFIPNEHELEGYVFNHEATYVEKAKEIINKGVKAVLITLGSEGSLYVDNKQVIEISAHKVKAIDTTGAGDTYCGALVVALSEGKNIKEAMKFATYASALSVTKKGATSSIPTREEVEIELKK